MPEQEYIKSSKSSKIIPGEKCVNRRDASPRWIRFEHLLTSLSQEAEQKTPVIWLNGWPAAQNARIRGKLSHSQTLE